MEARAQKAQEISSPHSAVQMFRTRVHPCRNSEMPQRDNVGVSEEKTERR